MLRGATAKACRHKPDYSPLAFLRVSPAGPAMPDSRLPNPPSAGSTPETLPQTASSPPPPLPPPVPASPLAPLPAQLSESSQSSSSGYNTSPSHFTSFCLACLVQALLPETLYKSLIFLIPLHLLEPLLLTRLGRSPYTKGKDADTSTLKSKARSGRSSQSEGMCSREREENQWLRWAQSAAWLLSH